MKKLNISPIDAIFSNGCYPIEFMLYYQNKIKTGRIRSALKNLSSNFWPMFGEYDNGIIYFEKYMESRCFEEQIVEEEFNSTESPRNLYNKYCRINPTDPQRLFHISILQYQDGTVIIPKLNHLAGDGYSYFYFLSLLAAVCREASIPFKKYFIRSQFKPHHQRNILKEFRFENIGLKPTAPPEKFTLQNEAISKTTIRDMIKDVASKTRQQVSTNDILTAMILKRTVENSSTRANNFQLTIPIDVRNQVKEYGSKFFGNGIMLHRMEFQTDEIRKNKIGELAVRIRQSMPRVNSEIYLKFLAGLENLIADQEIEQLRPFDPNSGCLVTNLSRLPATQLDFGGGKPDFIFLLTVEKNSAAILGDTENFVIRLVY
jgi:NRPS condensation-like uncharacterized protein